MKQSYSQHVVLMHAAATTFLNSGTVESSLNMNQMQFKYDRSNKQTMIHKHGGFVI